MRKLDILLIKSLCFKEIPEECKGLRSLIWKIILKYLPLSIED